jgi:hypothetical protein
MTPQLLREWITVLMRDLAIPGLGAFLTWKGYVTGALEPWHLPLLAGMMTTPLVGRIGNGPPPEPDSRPEIPKPTEDTPS